MTSVAAHNNKRKWRPFFHIKDLSIKYILVYSVNNFEMISWEYKHKILFFWINKGLITVHYLKYHVRILRLPVHVIRLQYIFVFEEHDRSSFMAVEIQYVIWSILTSQKWILFTFFSRTKKVLNC